MNATLPGALGGRTGVPLAVAALAAIAWVGPATPNVALVDTATTWIGLDLEHYLGVADRVWAGDLPYREIAFEYPPLSFLPILGARALGEQPEAFRSAFEMINGALVVFAALATTFAARRLCLPSTVQLAAGSMVAVGPVLLGGELAAARLDVLPMALVAGAAWAASAQRDRAAAGLIGLGAAAKLWPAVLILPLAALAWHRGGARAARESALVCLAGLAFPFAIAAAISLSGVTDMLEYQARRPLQIEATGATALIMLDRLGLTGPYGWSQGYGSINLTGGASVDVVTAASTVLAIAALASIGFLAARSIARATSDREACAMAMRAALALTVTLMVFSKVLSPQFLVWLLPLPLLVGRGRWSAAALVVVALLLTRYAIGDDYFAYAVRFETTPTLLFALRDAALIGLLLVSAIPLVRFRSSPGSPAAPNPLGLH